MKRFKAFVKRLRTPLISVGVVAASAVPSLAADGDAASLIGNAFDTVKTDVTGVLAIAVPVLVGIVGLVAAVKFGIKFVRKVGSAG
jgi:phage-related minor tail protein